MIINLIKKNEHSYWFTNGSSLNHNHIVLYGQTKLCLEAKQRRLYRILIWDQSNCSCVPSCSQRKLHSLLAGGKSECFGMFLSFKPKVCNAGVLGVQAILVDCRQGSQSQRVLRVAEHQRWRTGRHGRCSSRILKRIVQYQRLITFRADFFFQCLFFAYVPKRNFLWPLCIDWATDTGKGKAVPLQSWSGPEGSKKLRFPDFMTTAQDVGKVVSLTHRPPLPPGNAPGTHFC